MPQGDGIQLLTYVKFCVDRVQAAWLTGHRAYEIENLARAVRELQRAVPRVAVNTNGGAAERAQG